MDPRVKNTIWWGVTAVSAIFGIVWTWAPTPVWWPTVLAIVGVVVPIVINKPWSQPQIPPDN
jgi:hypothetical protein